jgi:hypothetical protein
MSSADFPVHIAAEASTIWPWIADLTKHSSWSPSPYQVDLVSGSAGEVGARYRSTGRVPGDRHHENEVEVTEVDVNRHFVFVARDNLGDFVNRFELRPAAAGTDVTFSMDSPPLTGMTRLLFPIAFPLIVKPDVRKRMRMLKSVVEGSAASA